MTLRIIVGVGVVLAVLLVVVAVNTLRVGPPVLSDVSPALDVVIDEDAAAERLAEAVRFRTISSSPDAPVSKSALLGLRQFLADNYPNVHGILKREIVNEYSLLYTWQGNEPDLKPILLAAHMDVVPVEPGTEADWIHPPFASIVADGFIWGRGTMDMKASLMGIMEAAEYLLGRGFTPQRTIYLAFGHDEEIGGSNGAAKIAALLSERGVRLEFTLDEGLVITHGIVPGVTRPAALIGVAEKGKISLEVIAHGRGGHSSAPPINTAASRLGRALDRLTTHQMPAALQSPVADMFEHLAPAMPLATRAVIANRWLSEPLLISRLEQFPATNASIRTTTAPTIIRGGLKPNVLPETATAVVDFRILPGDSIDVVIKHVEETIDDPEVTVRIFGSEPSEPSRVSDINSASFSALRTAVRQMFPDAVVAPGLVIGRTDSRRYTQIADNSYRFLPMRLGPKDIKRIHGTNERVGVSNYAEIIHFYVQTLWNATSASTL